MKVERDFYAERGVTVYIWSATVEGKRYCYQHSRSEDYGYRTQPPMELVEVEAQRHIMRAIQKDLFGERAR